jgi:hypothetical protein
MFISSLHNIKSKNFKKKNFGKGRKEFALLQDGMEDESRYWVEAKHGRSAKDWW